jgi:hypothetical protein
MKLKKYKKLFEEIDPVEIEYDNSDGFLYGRPNYSKKSIHAGYDPDKEDEYIQSEDMQHLLYLIRSLFKNVGIEADVDSEGLNISIYVVLNKREKMKNILSVFDLAKKLKNDILLQYESEFELWETKDGRPILTFNFTYKDELVYDGEEENDANDEEDSSKEEKDIPF